MPKICQKESRKSARQLIDSHNSNRHDNNDIAIIIRPKTEDIETLMQKSSEVLSENELQQFKNYIMHNRKIMDGYFCWNGEYDDHHDEFEEFKKN